MKRKYSVLVKLLLSFVFCVLASLSFADPPTQVMRLGFIQGTVTYSPAGVDEWTNANTNRPIVTGDRIWADAGALDEIQLGSAVLRMNENTSINVLNIANNSPQIELDQGTVNLHIWKMSYYTDFEIDTPNLAFSISQSGDYRIDVDSSSKTTTVTVRDGQATVYGENNTSYQINAGQSFSFSGTNLAYQALSPSQADHFDQWCSARNSLYDNSVSKKYLSSAVVGYTDLDTQGDWSVDSNYGNVWYPYNQTEDWAPYSQGEWSWIDPWGWTWVDAQPWGFVPCHYGRWAYINSRWGWLPGPIAAQPIYAPALVIFYSGHGLGPGNIGWMPLGPGDIFVPSYGYSNNYFKMVNINNTNINNTVINNFYRNPNQLFAYRNLNAPHALTAVSQKTFIGSQPVHNNSITVPKSALVNMQPTHVAPLVPTSTSVIGNAKVVSSPKTLNSVVLAKKHPPQAPLPFAATQFLLNKTPGQPLPPSALSQEKNTPSQIQVITSNHPPMSITGKGPNPIVVKPVTKPSVVQPIAKPIVTPNTNPVVVHPVTNPMVVHPVANPVVVHPVTNPVVVHPVTNPVVVHPVTKPVVVHPVTKPMVVHPVTNPVVVHPVTNPVVVHPVTNPVVVHPVTNPVVVHPVTNPVVVHPVTNPVVVHPVTKPMVVRSATKPEEVKPVTRHPR